MLNQTRTVFEPQQPLRLLRQGITRQILLTGALAPHAEPDVTTLAIPAPREYFLAKLREALSEQEITVEATQLVPTADPLTSSPLFTLTSPPLQELSQTINQNSDNLYAEAVFNQLKHLTTTNEETEALNPIQQQLMDCD